MLLSVLASLARLAASLAAVVAAVVVEDLRIRSARLVWPLLLLLAMVVRGVPLGAALAIARSYRGVLVDRLVPPLSVLVGFVGLAGKRSFNH